MRVHRRKINIPVQRSATAAAPAGSCGVVSYLYTSSHGCLYVRSAHSRHTPPTAPRPRPRYVNKAVAHINCGLCRRVLANSSAVYIQRKEDEWMEVPSEHKRGSSANRCAECQQDTKMYLAEGELDARACMRLPGQRCIPPCSRVRLPLTKPSRGRLCAWSWLHSTSTAGQLLPTAHTTRTLRGRFFLQVSCTSGSSHTEQWGSAAAHCSSTPATSCTHVRAARALPRIAATRCRVPGERAGCGEGGEDARRRVRRQCRCHATQRRLEEGSCAVAALHQRTLCQVRRRSTWLVASRRILPIRTVAWSVLAATRRDGPDERGRLAGLVRGARGGRHRDDTGAAGRRWLAAHTAVNPPRGGGGVRYQPGCLRVQPA